MSQTSKKYTITDDDGDKYDLIVTRRFCGCQAAGCVDDEIAIDVDGDGDFHRLQIPRDMTSFFEGLIDGDYKAEKNE